MNRAVDIGVWVFASFVWLMADWPWFALFAAFVAWCHVGVHLAERERAQKP